MKPRLGTTPAKLALAYLLARGGVLLANALSRPRLQPSEVPERAGRILLLVPARDEAATFEATLPGLLAQGADEVIVLDDESSDGTAEVARAAGARVISGTPPPDGWTGKNWACEQLARAAAARDGDLLVFTDADVLWRAGALGALVERMHATRAGLLTVFPRHETGTLGERLITPLNDAAVIGSVPLALRGRHAPVAANGQVMAFTASTYRAVGGHSAVSSELVEDMRLAERVRSSGETLVTALGGDALGVRMYSGYRSSVRGYAKSLPGLHRDSKVGMVATALLTLGAYTLPWLLPSSRLVWTVRALGLLDRAAVSFIAGRRGGADLAEGLLGPLSPPLALPVYVLAFGRRLSWKGRSYPTP